MRDLARECLSRARHLLSLGDEASLRYACLELRFAIEYITYSQLQAYWDELPSEALKKWTPKQLISEMLEVDPTADKSATIAYGLEPSEGVAPPPEEMIILGTDQRFSLKWANKNHNTLGNFLHAPTIRQIETGDVATAAAIAKKATAVVNQCEEILKSPIYGVNFGIFFDFTCTYCQTSIHKREGSFTSEQGVVCPNCSAVYDCQPTSEGKLRISPRKMRYECKSCAKDNYVTKHMVEAGVVLTCHHCGKKVTVHLALKEEDQTEAIREEP